MTRRNRRGAHVAPNADNEGRISPPVEKYSTREAAQDPSSPAAALAPPGYNPWWMQKARVLVVDDEQLIRWSLVERLTQEGYRTLEAATGNDALKCVGDGVDLVLLDYRLPDTDGLSVLKEILRQDSDMLVILLTAYSSVDSAVEIMKERIVGTSPAMRAVKKLLEKVAASPASTVLLTGESGTGKDLAAKVIHDVSSRAARPFMNITCTALADTLLDSELFGHERGAFTDARQQKRGLLETADGGTVFLDEVGDMVPALQAKLLRFLEEKTFKRVGGAGDIRVDVRVIAATNRNLDEAVEQGTFRDDLYYRLNVLPVSLPALRDRAEDIPELVAFFIDGFNHEFRKHVQGAEPDALRELQGYAWPGNVRELRNAVERAMLLAEGDRLGVGDFRC